MRTPEPGPDDRAPIAATELGQAGHSNRAAASFRVSIGPINSTAPMLLLALPMPTAALLYDVHGNLPALEAVLDDTRAAYALGSEDGSIELRHVAYDHERSAAAMREQFGDADWAIRSEHRLRTARM